MKSYESTVPTELDTLIHMSIFPKLSMVDKVL